MTFATGHLQSHPLPSGVLGALSLAGYQLLVDIAGVGAGRLGPQAFLLIAPEPEATSSDALTHISLHQTRLGNEREAYAYQQLAAQLGYLRLSGYRLGLERSGLRSKISLVNPATGAIAMQIPDKHPGRLFGGGGNVASILVTARALPPAGSPPNLQKPELLRQAFLALALSDESTTGEQAAELADRALEEDLPKATPRLTLRPRWPRRSSSSGRMLVAAERSGAVLVSAGAILLLWASLQKFSASSWSGRVISLSELAAGVAVLVLPGLGAAALLAGLFLAFTAVHVRGIRSGATSCQCFGEEDTVNPARAAALTALVALLAAGAAAVGAPSLRQLASHDAAALAWVPASALALALAWRVAFSGSAALMQITDGSGRLLERGRATAAGAVDGELLERRSFLLRVAVFGSALAAAPLRYILYPGTALAAVVRPWDCGSGNCKDGYTDFCCQISDGGANVCPESTFAGGWWMCTDYSGRKLCSEQGVRYYVDCNALPGVGFPGGCRCGNDSCSNRRVNCNVFRYGQCNTHIVGTTAVVCRMVVCENPSHISELHCSASLAVDDAVCGHEATCLEPPALELAGAGGA